MLIREIRVRPVVRYVVTDYVDDGADNRRSIPVGEFNNAGLANQVAADLCFAARVRDAQPHVKLDPARQLRIDTVRAPGAPHAPTRWELREVSHA